MAERERNLSSDETLEDASNKTEHHHLYDTLDILAKHLVHHIGVRHHVHGVGSFYLAVEVAIGLVAEEGFSCLD